MDNVESLLVANDFPRGATVMYEDDGIDTYPPLRPMSEDEVRSELAAKLCRMAYKVPGPFHHPRMVKTMEEFGMTLWAYVANPDTSEALAGHLPEGTPVFTHPRVPSGQVLGVCVPEQLGRLAVRGSDRAVVVLARHGVLSSKVRVR